MQATRLAVGRFELDAAARRLSFAGQPVALDWRAFEFVRLLAEARGAVVRRDELFAALWPDTAVEESSLTKVAGRARKAFEAGDPGVPYVETAARRGYRLCVPIAALDEPRTPVAGLEPSRRAWTWAAAATLVVAVVSAAVATLDRERAGANAYDQASAALRANDWEGRRAAARLLHETIRLDPGNARAFAALAVANHNGPDAAAVREQALRALELDPDCGYCEGALGFVSLFRFHDWGEADRRLARALALEPGDPQIGVWRAVQLSSGGRLAEALAAADRAVEADRYYARAHQMRAAVLYFLGRPAEALAAADRATSLDERTGWEWRSKALFALGRSNEGLDALFQHRDEWRPWWTEAKAVFAAQGERAAFEWVLERTAGRAANSNYPCWRAEWRMRQGEPELALAELEAGLDLEPPPFNYLYLRVEPLFEPLRGRARFDELTARALGPQPVFTAAGSPESARR